jgi:general stress protein 26
MTERVTLEIVLNELRRCHFAVLSTVDTEGISHSAGVNYGVSKPGDGLAIYVMTRRHLQKARNVAQNPNVSLVIPIPRLLLWFVPPATIQLRGHAEILDGTDKVGTEVFRHFWMGRRILDAYEQSRHRGETRICFLKITPKPEIRTYMVGYSIWQIKKRMESGAGKVVIPPEQLHSDSLSRRSGLQRWSRLAWK